MRRVPQLESVDGLAHVVRRGRCDAPARDGGQCRARCCRRDAIRRHRVRSAGRSWTCATGRRGSGNPAAVNSPRRAARRDCASTRLPKPKPGSRQIRSRAMPALDAGPRALAQELATRRRRHRRTPGACCIVRGSPCMCMTTHGRRRAAATASIAPGCAQRVDVVDHRGAGIDGGAITPACACPPRAGRSGPRALQNQRQHACELLVLGHRQRRPVASIRRRCR